MIRLFVLNFINLRYLHTPATPPLSEKRIVERFRAQTVWAEGVVESFALTGHPKAKRCHAWSIQDGSEKRYVTALEIQGLLNRL